MKNQLNTFLIYLLSSIGTLVLGLIFMIIDVGSIGLLGFFLLIAAIYITFVCTIPAYKQFKNQNSTQEVLANSQRLMLKETIEHFKIFFKKYGFTPSPEEIANIMTQYAIAASEGNSDLILFQFIPDEIPSPNKFFEETSYHVRSLLPNLPHPNIKEKFITSWNNSRNEISAIEVCELYAIQKATLSEEQQIYFRFNYELCAIYMLASFCDDLANSNEYENEESLKPLNEFTQSVLDLANKLGYSKQD